MAKQEFICTYCGRRVFAERGPLTALKLCRSCFEKARVAQKTEPDPKEGAPRDPS